MQLKRVSVMLKIFRGELKYNNFYYYTEHTSESFEAKHEAEEVGKIISDYVRGLTDRQQYIFISRFYMTDLVENIAKSLGLTESGVYKALTAIKQGLKSNLVKKGVFI